MERKWTASGSREVSKFLLQKNIKQVSQKRGEAGRKGSGRQSKMLKPVWHLAQRQTELLPQM